MLNRALQARRWAELPERGTPVMLRLIHGIAVGIGRWAARLLLYPLTLYFLISAHAGRRISREYLKRVHGHPGHWRHVFRHFHYFAAQLFHRVYVLRRDFPRLYVTLRLQATPDR